MLLNILLYIIIPLFTVVIMFLFKRKLLWATPLISMALASISYIVSLYLLGIEAPISTIFGYSEWRNFFLLALLIHLVITITLTATAYFIAYILKRAKK